MFCAVYCAPAMAQAIFDPALGIDRSRLVHGGQTFEWFEPACAGDTVTTSCELADLYTKGSSAFYVFASTSRNQEGEETSKARYTGIVRGAGSGGAEDSESAPHAAEEVDREVDAGELSAGTAIPELSVTPDKYLPYRYAGVSGDFTPIHIDAEFARAVGLPGIILHGLYTMAIVARAQIDAAGGDPRALRKLRVQFRGIAFPEAEIKVTGSVKEIVHGVAVVETWAVQGGRQVIRNAEAILAR
jgi:acyl dehydratase